MSKTNFSERFTLEHMLGIVNRTMLTGHTVGFATAAANPETGATGFTLLVAGNGYAEVPTTFQMDGLATDDVQQASNAAEVLFGEATANLGHPTHFYVRENGGEIIRYGVLPGGGFDYNAGVQPRFAAGVLVCTED